jgi:TetR/AcrR family transcriptional repressor of nem operon
MVSPSGEGSRSIMPRPREFDESRALDSAMDCFWRRGFEATSVRELADSMQLTGASLYNAFGDKHTLFVRALERYMDAATRERIARLEQSHPPKQAIRRFFADIVALSASDKQRRGCFLINSAIEVAPHDSRLGAEIARRLGEVEGFFRRCVSAGQADGSIPPGPSPRDLARLLLGVLLGIRVLARSRPQRALLAGVVRPALKLLDHE